MEARPQLTILTASHCKGWLNRPATLVTVCGRYALRADQPSQSATLGPVGLAEGLRQCRGACVVVRRRASRGAFVIGIVVAAPLHASAAEAQSDVACAQSFVANGISKSFQILPAQNLSEEQQVARLQALLRDNFDVRAIGLLSLGPYIRSRTVPHRNAYLAALEDFAVNAYVWRLCIFGVQSKNAVYITT